jgi:hypothetical protein
MNMNRFGEWFENGLLKSVGKRKTIIMGRMGDTKRFIRRTLRCPFSGCLSHQRCLRKARRNWHGGRAPMIL